MNKVTIGLFFAFMVLLNIFFFSAASSAVLKLLFVFNALLMAYVLWSILPKKEKDPFQKDASGQKPAHQSTPVKTEPYLTQDTVYGNHRYRRAGEDSSVYFVDEQRGIRKMLVDSIGSIQNFPGIHERSRWCRAAVEAGKSPQIRFHTRFVKLENRWRMIWEIQPDGMYWADEDGFGAEAQDEITLCADIDMEGNFTGPFRVYSIGVRRYYTDFDYVLEPDGTACITGYTGTSKNVTFPSEIDIYTVSAIGDPKADKAYTSFGGFGRNTTYMDGMPEAEQVTLPESIRRIYTDAFRESQIQSIVLPRDLEYIGSGVFCDCTRLTSIILPDKITSIEAELFSGCVSLTSITLPEGITSIERGAFQGCKSLETIVLPKSVRCIASDAFANCTKLTPTAYAGTCGAKYATGRNKPYTLIEEEKSGVRYLSRVSRRVHEKYVRCLADTSIIRLLNELLETGVAHNIAGRISIRSDPPSYYVCISTPDICRDGFEHHTIDIEEFFEILAEAMAIRLPRWNLPQEQLDEINGMYQELKTRYLLASQINDEEGRP